MPASSYLPLAVEDSYSDDPLDSDSELEPREDREREVCWRSSRHPGGGAPRTGTGGRALTPAEIRAASEVRKGAWRAACAASCPTPLESGGRGGDASFAPGPAVPPGE